ncbi:MAG: S41 family peptidase [Bacteroidetes bacterium]|jgi:Tol biopolymer transport system component/C-terminal processing protease CtpA/Prc|nr:S41 family peptidase [Bacteroidota bacterium]MDF1868161.1 S41 family peptidase [Saprospiraceae bacterium]
MKKNLILLIFGSFFCLQMLAQDSPLWMRYPALSPNGQNIVFSYQGDLYTVETIGGAATPLTLHEAHDYMPVWSHDGSKIAFASNRYGNFDVYMMPSTGGKAERLTFHSSSDFPSDFSADDDYVMFHSSRLDAASNQQYPSGVLPELYKVPVSGGMVKQVLTTPSQDTKVNNDGSIMVFHDRKGYEDTFRKHHTSSVARDIWKYETSTGKYTQLTDFAGEDRNPVFAPNQKEIYYLSEEKGSYNIFKMDLNNPTTKTQITFLENHPVRYLSVSKDGLICFSYNGEIYTKKGNERAQKVNIQIASDARYNPDKTLTVSKDATEMALSPNGKELAFVHRGEVFVSSIKEGTTKRITNTPEQERNISFSPDGKSILYASERNGSWNLYQSSLTRESEKYFFNSTILKEEIIIETPAEEFQPAYSPDGKEVAYLEERTALKVINLETKAVRQIVAGNRNYSYSDGDQHYAWSPDGKWFLVEFLQDKQWIPQAGLVSSTGGEVNNLTKSGYSNSTPRWSRDGQQMIWFSDRDGMKNHASWGGEADVYTMFFTQEGYDNYKLNKEEFELSKEEEEDGDEDDDSKEEKKEEKKKEDDKIEPIEIELDGIEDRKVRLSVHSTRLADAIISKDGEKLFYLARFEKGYDLWATNLRTRESKILSKMSARSVGNLILDKEGKNLFVLADGKISKIAVEDGKKKGVSMKGEMVLNETIEREYLFDHIWRQVEKKFYKVDLHEVKWDFYKSEYARFLPHINNNHDFAEMLSELLGELNASHTGARFRPRAENGDATAALGLFYDNDYSGEGLKIEEVMDKSPVVKKGSKIKPGTIIEKIDGQAITTSTNHYQLLNRKIGKYTLLSLFDPSNGERWEETVKPISLGTEGQLRYQRWVKNCREIVEKASGGTVGYVHVRGMNDGSYRTVYEDVLGKNHGKDALIVDTRFNGGGWLHDDLATFLDGKNYMTFMPRGQDLGNEPQFKWSKPSIVVMGESNYSDAHMFPYTYRALGIGKLLGMPVPGTGTAVWWETLQNGMVFGIPQVGMVGSDGKYLENSQLEPDIKVMNSPEKVSKGQDQQLEEAVKELLKTIKP